MDVAHTSMWMAKVHIWLFLAPSVDSWANLEQQVWSMWPALLHTRHIVLQKQQDQRS